MTWPRRFAAKKIDHREHRFQRSVAQFLNMALPLDAFWTSIDHASVGIKQGASKKARGVKAGLPDVWIIWHKGLYTLELKDEDGVVSDEQRACHFAIIRAGGKVGIAKDLSDVQFWLTEWGFSLRAVVDPRSITGARSVA